MEFTNPLWLWALSGLLLPIAIHVFSRKEGKIIMMGSLRYLRESSTAKFSHIKLNEIPLLILRCFLLILLAIFLSGAWLNWHHRSHQKWVVLEEGAEKSDHIKPLIKDLENQGFEIRKMAWGFPAISDETHHRLFDNYWTAVKELISESLDSIVVVSYNYHRKYKGGRIDLPPNMKWLILDVAEKQFMAQLIPFNNDSVWVRKGYTSSSLTSFETIKAPLLAYSDSLPLTTPERLDITIFTGEGFTYDEKIVMASLKAIQSVTPIEIKILNKKVNEWSDSSRGLIFWLANEPPQKTREAISIVYSNCNSRNLPLLIPSSEAAHGCEDLNHASWVITRRLNEEIALKQNFLPHLASLILPSINKGQADHRVLPEPMMWSSGNKNEAEVVPKNKRGNIDSYIIVILLLTLVTERWLAYKRLQ